VYATLSYWFCVVAQARNGERAPSWRLLNVERNDFAGVYVKHTGIVSEWAILQNRFFCFGTKWVWLLCLRNHHFRTTRPDWNAHCSRFCKRIITTNGGYAGSWGNTLKIKKTLILLRSGHATCWSDEHLPFPSIFSSNTRCAVPGVSRGRIPITVCPTWLHECLHQWTRSTPNRVLAVLRMLTEVFDTGGVG
jgi:hypothetical protein